MQLNMLTPVIIALFFTVVASETCGLNGHTPFQVPKIVGGQRAEKGEFPWQVSIAYSSVWYGLTHFCGGTILDEYTIISAAHCFEGLSANNIRVVAGEHNLGYTEGSEQVIFVEKIISHALYDSAEFYNDIAILKLGRRLTFNKFVKPVCLPNLKEEHTGYCIVTGWGDLFEGSEQGSDLLQKLFIPIVSDDTCRKVYGYFSIKDYMMCAGYVQGGRDSCQGDSGGPLVCQKSNGQYVLAGVVSWGSGCAKPGRYGVYTQVSHFIPWIERNRQ